MSGHGHDENPQHRRGAPRAGARRRRLGVRRSRARGRDDEDIAKRAGIRQAYVFRLFADKQRAVPGRDRPRCFDRVERRFREAPPRRRSGPMTRSRVLEAMGAAYASCWSTGSSCCCSCRATRRPTTRRCGARPHALPRAVAARRPAVRRGTARPSRSSSPRGCCMNVAAALDYAASASAKGWPPVDRRGRAAHGPRALCSRRK